MFDFDKTVTVRHLYHLIVGMGGKYSYIDPVLWPGLERNAILSSHAFLQNEVFGGAQRVQQLDTFFTRLRESGVDLMISSNGYLKHIHRALEMINLLHHFMVIHARDDLYSGVTETLSTGEIEQGTGGKEHFLTHSVLPFYPCVLFVDDEVEKLDRLMLFIPRNTRFVAIGVRGLAGIREYDMQEIERERKACRVGQGEFPLGDSKPCWYCGSVTSEAVQYPHFVASLCSVAHRDAFHERMALMLS